MQSSLFDQELREPQVRRSCRRLKWTRRAAGQTEVLHVGPPEGSLGNYRGPVTQDKPGGRRCSGPRLLISSFDFE
jgi:hypothetical protein